MSLVPVNQSPALAMTLPEKMRYCEVLSAANMLPESYSGNPGNVLVALELGSALGLQPVVAMMELYVVKGRPCMSAKLMNALIRKAGHRIAISSDANRATVTIFRRDDPENPVTTSFTTDQAQKAGLMGKDTWKYYTTTMLINRALSACARLAVPELLLGIGHTPDELGDDGTIEAVIVADTPPPKQESGYSLISAPAPVKRTKKAEKEKSESQVLAPPAEQPQQTLAFVQQPAESQKQTLWREMKKVFGQNVQTEGLEWLRSACESLGMSQDVDVDSVAPDVFDELMFSLIDHGENLKSSTVAG